MRLLQGILPGNLRGNPLVGFLVFVFALVGAYEAAGFIIAGDLAGLAYVGLAFIVGAFVIAMLNNWRRGLYIFLIWLLFEDFARKYLGNNMAIYFAKDALAAVVYLSYFLAWRRKQLEGFRAPFQPIILIFVWFGFLQVFNPASPHVIFGFLGMKLFFYYVPLMLVGYALVDSEKELRRFFLINLIPIVFVAALGIAQSILGPTFLNPAVVQEEIREMSTLYRVAPISGVLVYRPSSVFVSTGRYVDFLNVSFLLALGFLAYTLLRYQKGRRLAFISVLMISAAILLCASRGAFVWGIINVIVIAVACFWGSPWHNQEVVRILRAIFRVGLGIAMAVALLFFLFPDALLGRLALYEETLSPNSAASELTHRVRDYPLRNFMNAFNYDRWPYGYGIGTTALGTQYVTRIFGVKPLGVGVESGFGALIIEMGIVGLVLWLLMGLWIVTSTWKVVLKLRGSPWFPVGFVIYWFLFLMLFPNMIGGIQSYEDFILNAYFWFLLGVLFRLPHIKMSTEHEVIEKKLAQPQQRWIA
jgi:hypothetical protein